jgi:hypothetical protein
MCGGEEDERGEGEPSQRVAPAAFAWDFYPLVELRIDAGYSHKPLPFRGGVGVGAIEVV